MNGTWGWPLLLAAATALGLASGIFGVGIWDWVCWAGLLIPVLVVGRKMLLQWRAHVHNASGADSRSNATHATDASGRDKLSR